MIINRPYYLSLLFLVFCLSVSPFIAFSQVTIVNHTGSNAVLFGVKHIEEVLRHKGYSLTGQHQGSRNGVQISIKIADRKDRPALTKEGYTIAYDQQKRLVITAHDSIGAMYGALDLAEQLEMGKTLKNIEKRNSHPFLTVRALKFDLPWSSYRTGIVMEQHMEVCRDLAFWRKFLDMMAENRFNVLSLWNVHPFPFMVKPAGFPGANDFSDQEMARWKFFWTRLFRMARERGIEPYIVNWNIAVSPQFAKKYGVQERNDTSAIIKRYTKEAVTQVINEYPDLAGIGITLADWMSNFKSEGYVQPKMTPHDREKWIEETVIAGIKAANRPVKLLHRSVLSSDPDELRSTINKAGLPDTTLVEVKFNMSHGFSTPQLAITHDSQSGKMNDGYWNPVPSNYRIEWMVRNEDFFILRWGQPGFIRQHIVQNTKPYVNGYFIGSEGYIPAKDFAHKPGAFRSWTYAFEKQWLFYKLWGRLLYDPSTPDAVFETAFSKKYGFGTGKPLLKAFAAGSQMPLKLASFYASSWDYTLYSEGFLAPFADGKHDNVSSFISIDELISHSTLDTSYLSIPDFVKLRSENRITSLKVTPLQLADSLEASSRVVFSIDKKLRIRASKDLICELDDAVAWAYLSDYFACKLRAGVALQTFRSKKDPEQQQKAIELLNRCVYYWQQLCTVTGKHYQEVPYIDDHSSGGNAFKDARRFSWIKYLPQVKRDIELAKE